MSPDRLTSLGDQEMRHGRKSKSKTFTGYKRHIAVDANIPGLICAVEVLPANLHEHEALPLLKEQLEEDGARIAQLHIDRGYLPSPVIDEMRAAGAEVISKPPSPAPSEFFSKDSFVIDFANKTITCPNDITVALRLGKTIAFPMAQCRVCPIRSQCTEGRQRQVSIHKREEWYREMSSELDTTEGRALRRERLPVEHTLARVSAIQGNRARFRGIEKNLFDTQRVAVVNNIYVINALEAA